MSNRATFTDTELNSNDGMLTSVWGPALWHTLHTISFNYPVKPTPEQKHQYGDFVMSLKNVLPCGACRKNLESNLIAVPMNAHALRNRATFSRWMYRLHEQVNTMLNKKSGLSYDMVAQRYENFRARCRPDVVLKVRKSRKSSKSPKTSKASKVEDGCVEPVTGIKSKCVISIIPKEDKCPTFMMDEKCYQTRTS